MKKIIPLVLCLFLINILNAQKKKTEIVIDWQKLDKSIKEETILDPVQFGSFHTFRIEGINKFLYEVTLEGKKIELETPIPTELQTLFRLSREELADTVTDEEVEEKVQEVGNAEKKLNTLIELKTSNYFSQMNQKNNLLEPAKTAEEKFFIQEAINALQEKVDALKSFEEDVNKYLLQIKELSNELFKLKLIRVELIILAQKDISASEMKKLVNKVEEPKKIKQLHKELTNSFNKLKRDYLDFLKDAQDNEKEVLNNIFKKLEESFKTLDEAALLSLYSEVNFLYTELKNENNFKVVSPPTQADGDIVNYEVTITPSQTNTLGPNRNPINFNFDVPVKGGLKVDFSVGPIFSFGKGSRDEKYYSEISDTPDKIILRQRDNNNSINPGIGALMHFYKRSGTNTSFGGLFGVGAGFQTIEDVNLSFYTGFSLVMGKKQKIMLNTGISFLNVERLKETEFEIDKEYNSSDFDLNNVTEKVFKPSFFLSLTYNITNRVER